MRIAMLGSGGLGAFYGGLLARAGEEVTFVARGANLAALRTEGLTVRLLPEGEFHLRVRATDDPREVGSVDLVWCCVKTYDLDGAARQMTSLVGSETMVLTVQNGVDAPERVAALVGPGRVLGGVALGGATLEGPGVVVQKTATRGPIVFGELEGGVTSRTERLRDTLRAAAILAEVHADIRVAIWEKLIMLGAGLGLSALTRLTYRAMLDCPETRELLHGVMREMEAVARARGVRLPDGSAERLFEAASRFPGDFRGSMYFDLVHGRRLELEDLNGTVVRLGRELGVLTPLNFAVYAALKPYAAGMARAA